MVLDLENIEREIDSVKKRPMTVSSLEWYTLLCRAKKYLCKEKPTLSEEDAKKWVAHMVPPGKWTMDQTTTVMEQMGYHFKPCVFYAVMNMLWSDYGKTMEKHGMDRPAVWAELARDFIGDPDAEDMKVGRYWRDIVRHE